MAFNRSNSIYRCDPKCPGRNATCHANCPTHAADRAKAAAGKAEEQRQRKGVEDAKSVLIESRQHFKRANKIK